MPSSLPPSSDKFGILRWIRPFIELGPNKRPVGFIVTVALAVGVPTFIGVWLGHFAIGVAASLGGLASIYLPQTSLPHRLTTMGLVTFGFCASFTLSLLAGFHPWTMTIALGFVTFWATFICRYFAVQGPGSFFFILVACIASAIPFDLSLIAERSGVLLFGCLGAFTLTLAYSLIQQLNGYKSGMKPVTPDEPRTIAILLESATIAVFIAASYLLALWLGLDKPYWAPISCAAILQGASFRAIWQRKVHRIIGTAIGMGFAWIIFSLNPGPWSLALLIIVLSFVIEMLITRNYGLAVVFITPLTIILAEAESASLDINGVIFLRMIDVVLGSTVGYLGGLLLHQHHIYARIEQRLLRLCS